MIVGMSGGVDSSVALILLKEQGFEPIGVTLKLPVWQGPLNLCRENICCTKESIEIAESVCKKLNAPYYLVDAQKEFKNKVIDYFTKELKKYRTPNPCVICNRNLKFHLLIGLARKLKVPYVATGHYAKIKKSKNVYELLKSRDKNKDQSYSLSFLTQKQLRHIILPLENYTKEKVYAIAKKEGFKTFEKIKQSQNFCFVSDKSLPIFIKKEISPKAGPIIDTKGNILARHEGLSLYTIGQRKRLKIPDGPYFVKVFDTRKNALIVTKNKKDLCQKEVILSPYNFISGKIPKKSIKVKAKIRYQQRLSSAILYPPQKNKIRIVFQKAQRAVTPGQFCAFYQGKKCLGSGAIN